MDVLNFVFRGEELKKLLPFFLNGKTVLSGRPFQDGDTEVRSTVPLDDLPRCSNEAVDENHSWHKAVLCGNGAAMLVSDNASAIGMTDHGTVELGQEANRHFIVRVNKRHPRIIDEFVVVLIAVQCDTIPEAVEHFVQSVEARPGLYVGKLAGP